tara:strand:- start:4595 stop:5698 length:1104 start_codon:yes stop_codon:yes gene_type:complete
MMSTAYRAPADASSEDEWEDSDCEDATPAEFSSNLHPPTKSTKTGKRKRTESDDELIDDDDDDDDDELIDTLARELLGDGNVKKPRTDEASLATPEEPKKLTELRRGVKFEHFNLAETGAVVWRDEPAQGNDPTIVWDGQMPGGATEWFVLSIWFGGQRATNTVIATPEFKKGLFLTQHQERHQDHELAKNQLWIRADTLKNKANKIVFHKKRWPLGRHYMSSTSSKHVPMFMMTLAPFVDGKVDMDRAVRTENFRICSKRQPAQLRAVRGLPTTGHVTTGNIRRNKHIARLETENRAHAAQVVKVNADNRRLAIRDTQHTKGFEHLLNVAKHMKANLTQNDSLTLEVLKFVSGHIKTTARSKRAMC